MGMHKTPPRSEYDDSPEPAVRYRRPAEPPPAWSPPTPHVRTLPGWNYTGARWTAIDDPAVQAGLAALKAKLASAAVPSGRVLDPEHVKRYVAACEAKKAGR